MSGKKVDTPRPGGPEVGEIDKLKVKFDESVSSKPQPQPPSSPRPSPRKPVKKGGRKMEAHVAHNLSHTSAMVATRDEIEYDLLKTNSAKANEIFVSEVDIVKNYEGEVHSLFEKRMKKIELIMKTKEELAGVEQSISILKPRYEENCRILNEKLELKKNIAVVLKDAKKKSLMMRGFSKMEMGAAMQAQMQLLSRAVYLTNSKLPPTRRGGTEGVTLGKNHAPPLEEIKPLFTAPPV